MATIKDIARETGLGIATISSYLNGGSVRKANKEKIEAAIEKLHFEVNEMARGLKTNKTKIVGIVIPELNNVFYAEIITEVEDLLRSKGYATMLCDCRSDGQREEEALEFLYKKRVDGLIWIPTKQSSKTIEKYELAKKPVVVVDRRVEQNWCDCVLSDNLRAAKEAVGLFTKAGHKKIAMITGPEDIYTAKERRRGYRESIKELLQEEPIEVCGNYTIQGGMEAMLSLLNEKSDISAVLISNYEMTLGSMIALNDQGIKIPEELSLIGFDNIQFAKASIPKLTIITQPTDKMGRLAAERILERMEDVKKESGCEWLLKTGILLGKSIKNLA